jgi:hypothetical protein
MTNRVRVNLANARWLLELVGISDSEVETIIRFPGRAWFDRGRPAAQHRARWAADSRRHPLARGLRALRDHSAGGSGRLRGQPVRLSALIGGT